MKKDLIAQILEKTKDVAIIVADFESFLNNLSIEELESLSLVTV